MLEHLRTAGYSVRAGDADLYGWARWTTLLRTFAVPMRRWWVRYHLGGVAFAARTLACEGMIEARRGTADVILQVGATFEVPVTEPTPVVLFCDSNIQLARRAIATRHSEAAWLSDRELDEVREREAQVYRRAKVIFTMSDWLRRSFIEDFGIPAERLITVHCGPNIPVPDIAGADATRRAGPPTILFVGRDFERKGADLLLEAFRAVRARIPDARLLMVGGGAAAERMPAMPGVEFLGFLSRDSEAGRRRMDDAYRTATALCIPTRFEPFGTSFVEAMMYGLPCVGPNAWAVPEIIEEGTTGHLVPPADSGALAEALVKLLSDRDRAAAMGAAGRQRAIELFSWEHLVTRMARGFELAVGG